MARPNFFCGIETLQWILEHEPAAELDDIDLTVDLIEAPFLFVYTSDTDSWTMRVMGRGEIYDHKEGSGVEKAKLTVDKASGQGSGQTTEAALRDNMGAFFEACRRLSRYIRDEKWQKLYEGLDPEQAGLMLEVKGGKLTARTVAGKERPELVCTTLFGGVVKCRPYMEDFWDRSMTDAMSVEEKIEAAEGGDKFAMAQLATAYLNGDDEVEQDPEKAAYWYRKEAELEDSEGAFNLGLLYAKGFGVERDFEQAAEWMEKAVAWGDPDGAGPAKQYRAMAENLKKAEAGDAAAMYELAGGYMTLGGSLDQAGAGADYAESLKWAQKAVDAGNANGCWVLALAYEHGRGVETDDEKAIAFYKQGAEGGSAACQHSYACRLLKGEGVEEDAAQALGLLEQSAEQGYGLAYKALGHLYETGEGVEPDFDKELEYYEKACEAEPNNAELLRHVGYQYTNLLDGDEEHWLRGVERAVYWLRKAAELGDRTAMGGLPMYERIRELHKEGKIEAGTSLDKCMSILSNASKEEEKRQKQEKEKAERERRERDEAERRTQEEKKKAEQQAAYDRAMEEWRAKKSAAEEKRADELARQLALFEQNEKAAIEKEYDAARKAAESRLSELMKEEQAAQEKLSALGFFAFGEKSEQKKRIKAAQTAMEEAKAALDSVKKAHDEALAALPGRVSEKKTELTREIEARYPLPRQPAKRDYFPRERAVPTRGMTAKQIENEGFKADILAWMEPGVLYSIEDIVNGVPSLVAGGLSLNRVSALMTQLCDAGEVFRTIDKRKNYYSLA